MTIVFYDFGIMPDDALSALTYINKKRPAGTGLFFYLAAGAVLFSL